MSKEDKLYLLRDRDDYINATIDKAIKSLKSTASIDNEKYKQEDQKRI